MYIKYTLMTLYRANCRPYDRTRTLGRPSSLIDVVSCFLPKERRRARPAFFLFTTATEAAVFIALMVLLKHGKGEKKTVKARNDHMKRSKRRAGEKRKLGKQHQTSEAFRRLKAATPDPA
ncbi:hypothetical protein BU16DRAFT_178176 [Lophium mytilinum]|uniref:Uncharacterized protein n=1 Tax=Lophium mytilinum TaxID=390894 RepID=A0A6A6QBE0_9PEZI|nr:hypothetical protein BU16DRAFT_178176 [Lophium mytilinum]